VAQMRPIDIVMRLSGGRARVFRALNELGGRATLANVAKRAGVSAAQALYHVIELERMGVLVRRGGELELTELGRQVAKLLDMLGAGRTGLVEALAMPRLTAHIYLSDNRVLTWLATAALLATWILGMVRLGGGALMGLYVTPLLGLSPPPSNTIRSVATVVNNYWSYRFLSSRNRLTM